MKNPSHSFQAFFVSLLVVAILSACSHPDGTASESGPSAPTLPPVTAAAPTLTPEEAPAAPAAEVQASLSPITDEDHILGNIHADSTLLIYADFQSPASAFLMRMLPEITARHSDSLRIIFRPFPLLTVNQNALITAQAAEAAALQGYFWDIAEILFLYQDTWSGMSQDEIHAWLIEKAHETGLDQEQFILNLDSPEITEALLSDFYQSVAAGLFNAPTIFLNSNEFLLPLTLENLEASIRLEELKARQLPAYPDFNIDINADYTAHIYTSSGPLEILLYPQYAPMAVNSFITLAGEGWYDNTPVYRVVQGSFIEAGDPTGTGFGDPGYVFPTEVDPTLDFSQAGMIALVSPAPDANGSNFFITLEPMPHLNGYRTIFGRVINGLNLLEGLDNRSPMDHLLTPPQEEILDIVITKVGS